MRAIILSTILLFSLFLSCGRGKSDSQSKAFSNEDLIGTWETVRLTVRLVDIGGGAKDSSFVLPMGEAMPPLTHFYGNGTYRNDLRGEGGEVVESLKGYWHLNGDSLYMRSEANGMTAPFGVRVKGNGLEMHNLVDWDADGEKDDEMKVELRKR